MNSQFDKLTEAMTDTIVGLTQKVTAMFLADLFDDQRSIRVTLNVSIVAAKQLSVVTGVITNGLLPIDCWLRESICLTDYHDEITKNDALVMRLTDPSRWNFGNNVKVNIL